MKRKLFFCMVFVSLAIAIRAQLPDRERLDLCYQQNRQFIDSVAQHNGMCQYVEMTLNYDVPKWKRQMLQEIVMKREYVRTLCDMLYTNDVLTRAKARNDCDASFRDSIDIILLPHNPNISGENISRVLLWADTLKLDYTTLLKFRDKALDIAHRIRKDRLLDVWDEEISFMRENLSEIQLDLYLLHKNKDRIISQVSEVRRKLNSAGLATQLDSADIKNCTLYYFEQEKIKDIYHNHPKSCKKMLVALGQTKPKMLKMAEGIEKNSAIKEKQTEVLGKEFIW